MKKFLSQKVRATNFDCSYFLIFINILLLTFAFHSFLLASGTNKSSFFEYVLSPLHQIHHDYINKAISFTRTLISTHHINCRPRAKSEYFYSLCNRMLDLLNVLAKKVNSIWIVNNITFLKLVISSKSIFRDNQWKAITGVNLS